MPVVQLRPSRARRKAPPRARPRATYRERAKRPNQPWLVVGLYLPPLVLSLFTWMSVHPSSPATWTMRMLVFVQSVCGPIGCFIPRLDIAVPIALLEWGIWLVVVTQTRVREWPYPAHFLLAWAWVCWGCLPFSGYIT